MKAGITLKEIIGYGSLLCWTGFWLYIAILPLIEGWKRARRKKK